MECDQCNFICRPLLQLFLKHYRIHLNEESSPFPHFIEEEVPTPSSPLTCGLCPETFENKDELHGHSHNRPFATYPYSESYLKKMKPYPRLCDQCGKSFDTEPHYHYHRRLKCKGFKCEICKEPFTSEQTLQNHILENHGVDPSEKTLTPIFEPPTSMCFICGIMVKNAYMDRHMLVHSEERPFICDICGKRFKFKTAIRDHILQELEILDYVCEVCGRGFIKRCYLNKHMRYHHMDGRQSLQHRSKMWAAAKDEYTTPQNRLECDLCGCNFPNKILLHQHMRKEVICALCDEIFSSNEVLKQHVLLVHNLEEYKKATKNFSNPETSLVYPCELCGRRFTSQQQYQQHVKMETKCELCENFTRYNDQKELKMHVENEHNLKEYRKVVSLRWRKGTRMTGKMKEYTCHLCGKTLFYKRTLLLHMRMHSGLKPFKCEYCGKAYVNKHSLASHLVSEKNLRKHACTYCGKRYNFNSDLIVHVKQHHETRQFSCHVCGKEFGLMKYLKDHESIHSQAKPFTCEHCNAGFRLKKFLLKHQKKYHLVKGNVVKDAVMTISNII